MNDTSTSSKNEVTPLIGPPIYRSYVLRFWQERSEESSHTVWRFSLEDPLTDQRYGFPSLDPLVDWLKLEMAKSQEKGDSSS